MFRRAFITALISLHVHSPALVPRRKSIAPRVFYLFSPSYLSRLPTGNNNQSAHSTVPPARRAPSPLQCRAQGAICNADETKSETKNCTDEKKKKREITALLPTLCVTYLIGMHDRAYSFSPVCLPESVGGVEEEEEIKRFKKKRKSSLCYNVAIHGDR